MLMRYRVEGRTSRKASDNGEFDPGSERTLAARLKHASRAAAGASACRRAANG